VRVRSGVLNLSTPPLDFACVKVKASPDVVLAALAATAYGMPRDLIPVIRGAPCPADGRDMGRRAVLYKLERDGWTAILREGDRYASYDAVLAQRLSRSLNTRAFALFIDGNKADLAYDLYEKGEPAGSFLQVQSNSPESSGIPSDLARLAPEEHARAVLGREDATNDRLHFRHFELPGMLRGRWDLSFERAVLVPELVALDESSEERRVRMKRPAPAGPSSGPLGEPRGVQDLLQSIIADRTRGL